VSGPCRTALARQLYWIGAANSEHHNVAPGSAQERSARGGAAATVLGRHGGGCQWAAMARGSVASGHSCGPSQSATATSLFECGQVGAHGDAVVAVRPCWAAWAAQPFVGGCGVQASACGLGCAVAVRAVSQQQHARFSADIPLVVVTIVGLGVSGEVGSGLV
jgi:hypothetical protein